MSVKERVLRQLINIWIEFEANLNKTPIIDKLNRNKFRLDDYKLWLLHHRQQVIEGGRWIALAASSISNQYADLRSTFIKHAATEHKDYKMLERNFISIGGTLDEIQSFRPNIGTQILSAYMFHNAGKPDPFDLLGAMFIIEGLGQNKAAQWGAALQEQLQLPAESVNFLIYHGENDDHHMNEFDFMLSSRIMDIDGMAERIVTTAQAVARLYLMQIEEIK